MRYAWTRSASRRACGGGPGQGSAGPASGFTLAARLVDEGRYETALPILRCVADQGHGYEIAQ
ncbi:MAG: hypothetical protein JJ884_00975 [Maricaulis sp.]|nr:hypothetical protein [Maricaulis sp.]MBO6846068.1 hypothetical protein [Maricaulis sp.]MBO6876056.1 hypothetical protein [Maricaulis sp.]